MELLGAVEVDAPDTEDVFCSAVFVEAVSIGVDVELLMILVILKVAEHTKLCILKFELMSWAGIRAVDFAALNPLL